MPNFNDQCFMRAILLFIVVFGVFSCRRAENSDPVPTRVYGVGAESVRSYDYRSFEPFLQRDNDSIYVINFWATWCAPCVKELPHFKQAAEKYADDKVRVLLVSLDMKREVEKSLLPFIGQHGIGNLALHLHEPDADAWIPKVSPEWSGALPATLIYTRGKRKFYERSFTADELEKEINSFLN